VIRYLTVADIIAINGEMLRAMQGGALGARDEGLLESAALRPRMAAHYEGADLAGQAATLIAGIALAHAFVDGNKRTALLAGAVFLALNGQELTAQPLELAQRIEALVTHPGMLADAIEGFADWIRQHCMAAKSELSGDTDTTKEK
jgi:death-on-curing protein